MKKNTKIRNLIRAMLKEEMEIVDLSNKSQELFDEGFDKIHEGLGMMMTATDMLDPDMADAMMQFIGNELGAALDVIKQSYHQAKEAKNSNIIQGPWKQKKI